MEWELVYTLRGMGLDIAAYFVLMLIAFIRLLPLICIICRRLAKDQ